MVFRPGHAGTADARGSCRGRAARWLPAAGRAKACAAAARSQSQASAAIAAASVGGKRGSGSMTARQSMRRRPRPSRGRRPAGPALAGAVAPASLALRLGGRGVDRGEGSRQVRIGFAAAKLRLSDPCPPVSASSRRRNLLRFLPVALPLPSPRAAAQAVEPRTESAQSGFASAMRRRARSTAWAGQFVGRGADVHAGVVEYEVVEVDSSPSSHRLAQASVNVSARSSRRGSGFWRAVRRGGRARPRRPRADRRAGPKAVDRELSSRFASG